MTNNKCKTATTIVALTMTLFLPPAASAHHSDAGLDVKSELVLRGTVVEYRWTNPHVYFTLQANEPGKRSGRWEVQMGAIPPLSRTGWSRDSLSIGDQVVVHVHPALDGRNYGLYMSAEKDGRPLPLTRTAPPREAPIAATLAGVWRGDRATIPDFTEFYDRLALTDKGREARDKFDEMSTMNPMATCMARPTPSTLVSAFIYLEQIEFLDKTVILRTEVFDTARTVYMDGRGHPRNGVRTLDGHSIGHWEKDVLVVDTTLFADHRSPYQNGVPSGARKHVVERYRLKEGGTRLVLDITLEDPEYLARPFTHRMEWIYSPELKLQRWNCDPQTTRKFLPPGAAAGSGNQLPIDN